MTRFHPIIYVRGYAMTQSEINETTADPFCGFNIGSTTYRAVADIKKPPRKFIFESPLVRLASEFGYRDVYEEGFDILDADWANNPANQLSSRSVIIHRYYDESSELLGLGKTESIETFANKLSQLILRVRDLVCANPENGVDAANFRCYLVAHSMGGLVSRAFLQNPKLGKPAAKQCVDKFFTYATPHNGIDVVGINAPGLNALSIKNFDRDYMAKYLGIAPEVYRQTKRADWLPQGDNILPSERVFCMVGSNRMDYEVAFGASRTFVGHGSDGLVRIENATLTTLNADGSPGEPCAKAFAYRAHSGHFGIVNSEEAYQNLTRFLFGDVRVDIWMEVSDIRLPQALANRQKDVNALYQFEVLAAPRGKPWYLTRRTSEEDSAACLSYQAWQEHQQKKQPTSLYLSSVFLANHAKINPARRSLAYSLSLGVRVPDYELNRALWMDEHYEGGYVFNDSLILELEPPQAGDPNWSFRYAWQGKGATPANQLLNAQDLQNGKIELKIPVESGTTPGMSGNIRFVVSAWNTGMD